MSHPNKEIEAAVQYAIKSGWRLKEGGSHCWGKLFCPYNDLECRCGEFCIQSVWSTPRNSDNHAKQIRKNVNKCLHQVNKDFKSNEKDQ